MGSKDDGSGKASKRSVMIAGASAGVISRFFIAPLDVVKIRLQLQAHTPNVVPRYNGVLPTVKTILREEGVRAFWKGNIPAELMYLAYGGLQFLAYREVTIFLSSPMFEGAFGGRQMPKVAQDTVGGATAAAFATSATYPLDLLRTRFAAQGNHDRRVYKSLLSAISDIYRNEGPTGYFKGLGAGLAQIVPNMGLFFGANAAVHSVLSRGSYTTIIPFNPPKGSGWDDALSGAIASVIAKTGVFPLDLIRKRLQVQGPHRMKYVNGEHLPVYTGGVLRTGKDIVLAEGVRGLYRGLGVALVKAVPTSAITMWVFGRALRIMQRMEEESIS